MRKDKKKKETSPENVEQTGEETTETIEAPEQDLEVEEPERSSDEQIAELENQVNELNERMLRRAAEFENYKRRTESEHLTFLKYAGESFISLILPVYDDLHRSFDHIADEKNIDSLKKGIELVIGKFDKILKEQGVSKIEWVGEQFDFNFHEALKRQETNEYEPNTVVREIEAGYMYTYKVIRHAKVIVAAEPEPETKTAKAEDNSESGKE